MVKKLKVSAKGGQVKWLEFSWPGAYPIQCFSPFKAWVYDFADYGFRLSKMAVTFSKDTFNFYVIKKEYEESGKQFFKQVLKDPALILNVFDDVNKTANKIFQLEKSWATIDFSKKTDIELIKYHKQLFTLDERLWRKGQIQNLLELHNSYVTDYVRKNLKLLFGVKKELEYFQIISTPKYSTITERQDDDFINLVKKISNSSFLNKYSKQIFNHWCKYCWMSYGWTGPVVSLETIKENITESLKQPKVLKDIEKRISFKKKVISKQSKLLNKLPDDLKSMSVILRASMEAKAIRVDAHSLTYFLGDSLLSEIGKRLNLSLNQLRVLDPERARTLFKNFDIDQINQELKYVLYWFEPKSDIKKFIGPVAHNKMKQVIEGLPKIKKTNIIKGELAYPGKVKGEVKIVLSAKDISQFKKGQILVTGMTDPGFVPAMKKAKALITNYGGITCHASIISREFHIPCVIGTKIATKVLKDGDRVEVDATKGIVKKL